MSRNRWTVAIATFASLCWVGCVGQLVEPDDDTVGDDDDVAGDDDDIAGDDDDTADDDDVADDDDDGPVRCWTVAPTGGSLAVIQIDFDAREHFEVGVYGSGLSSSFHTAGLASVGDDLYMAGYHGNTNHWIRVNRSTDVMELGIATHESSITATVSGHLAAFCGTGYCEYASFEDLLDGAASHHSASIDLHASRLALDGDELFTAWHSTNELDVFDRHSGALLRTVPLEGWNGWVWGLGAADGLVHLLDGDATQTLVVQFDGVTGERLAEVALNNLSYDHKPTGLWCGHALGGDAP